MEVIQAYRLIWKRRDRGGKKEEKKKKTEDGTSRQSVGKLLRD